jgi:hypothetical protein
VSRWRCFLVFCFILDQKVRHWPLFKHGFTHSRCYLYSTQFDDISYNLMTDFTFHSCESEVGMQFGRLKQDRRTGRWRKSCLEMGHLKVWERYGAIILRWIWRKCEDGTGLGIQPSFYVLEFIQLHQIYVNLIVNFMSEVRTCSRI